MVGRSSLSSFIQPSFVGATADSFALCSKLLIYQLGAVGVVAVDRQAYINLANFFTALLPASMAHPMQLPEHICGQLVVFGLCLLGLTLRVDEVRLDTL